MTAPAPRNGITEPGVYDLDSEVYLADPVVGGSLNSTGARKLLRPSCPALFHHWRTSGEFRSKPQFDLGRAAHRMVLGVGPDIVPVDASDWRTDIAKADRDIAYDAGLIPLLRADYLQVCDMAEELSRHRQASELLTPEVGMTEQTAVWRDSATEVVCRAMIDRIVSPIIVDYKTIKSANPDYLERAIVDYDYAFQGSWYLDGAVTLGLVPADAPFVLVFQEKTPPYIVTVAQLRPGLGRFGPGPLMRGRERCEKARYLYRRCSDSGHWPGYSGTVVSLDLPRWAQYQFEANEQGFEECPA